MVVMAVALVSCHRPWGRCFLGGIGGGAFFGLLLFLCLLILVLGQLGVGHRSTETWDNV